MTTEIDNVIRRGADLALAKERFPDVEPFSGRHGVASALDPMDLFMSAGVTRDCADCAVQGRGGHGDHVRFGVRFGRVVVFEKSPADLPPLSDSLYRLSTEPRHMRAIVAAGSAETWEAYQRREAEIASDEFARKVIGR